MNLLDIFFRYIFDQYRNLQEKIINVIVKFQLEKDF